MTSTHHVVDRVRIRPGSGPRAPARARRLARIAYERLPGTLERALAGVEKDLVIESLTVTFPVDPDELDDEAVAWLWASLVRESVDRARTPARSGLADVDGHTGPTPGAGSAAPWAATAGGAGPADDPTCADASEALLRWVRDDVRPPESLLLALLHRADLLGQALDRVAEPWRTAARERVLRHATPAQPSAGTPAEPAAAAVPVSEGTAVVDPPSVGTALHVGPATPAGREHDPRGRLTGAGRGELRQVPRDAGPTPISRHGGLVLLHYRLRGLLEEAVAAEPGGDEGYQIAVRSTLLALVTGEEDARDDPLVRLLAGDPDWAAPAALTPYRFHDPAAAREHAETVLRAFAGDLPGFAASTAAFVREQWLRRGALLVEDRNAVLLTLERRPLDLLLDRLPYPIGALRLPWTPPLFVGWGRR